MNLIDLRGRQDEPAVRRVLEQSHGSTEALEEACAHYRSGEWTFIGWQEGKRFSPAPEQSSSQEARSGSARSRSRPRGDTAVSAARSWTRWPGAPGRAGWLRRPMTMLS